MLINKLQEPTVFPGGRAPPQVQVSLAGRLLRQGVTRFTFAAGQTVAILMLALMAFSARADLASDLELARHDLAVSEQVLARMNERAAFARSDPAIPADQRELLDQYLSRMQRLVAANRERVETLTRQLEQQPVGVRAEVPAAGGAPGVATEAEEISALEKKLGESLAEFDELLLEEARRARTRTDGRSRGGSSGGSAAASAGSGATGAGPESGSVAATAAGTEGQGGGEAESRQSAGEPGSPGGRILGPEAGASGTSAAVPPDVGDGSDDDVVARQIRKAAESETDPELRKKLWEEYRKYKQGTKG